MKTDHPPQQQARLGSYLKIADAGVEAINNGRGFWRRRCQWTSIIGTDVASLVPLPATDLLRIPTMSSRNAVNFTIKIPSHKHTELIAVLSGSSLWYMPYFCRSKSSITEMVFIASFSVSGRIRQKNKQHLFLTLNNSFCIQNITFM